MAAAIFTPVANPTNKGRDQYLTSIVDLTPSTSYPALGEPITAANFGLNRLLAVDANVAAGSAMVTFDPTNSTLRIWTSIGGEAGTGTDQSAKVIRAFALGM
jgi:hypothetical protein